MSATKDVITYAKSHGGIISTEEAIAIGMPRSTVNRRVSDGVFVRVGRGVLALPGTATRPDLMLRAASRVLGAVVSHESAAVIHGMEPIQVKQPSVTVSHRGTHTFPGVTVHQATDLLEEHTTEIGGLRVTTRLRTVIDLAKVLKRKRLTRLITNEVARGMDLDELMTLYLSLTRQGKPGMKMLGELLLEMMGEPAVPETVLEAKLSDLLEDAGLPRPVKQFRAPWLKPVNGRVDLAYVDEQIVIEADSRRWHLDLDAFETDKRRDIAAQLAGWIVIRITWKMIIEDPAFVVATIRKALELRGGLEPQ